VPEAERAVAAGVDAIVALVAEAGGHLAGGFSTLALVPQVMDAVTPRPVVADGGIADGRSVVAIFMRHANVSPMSYMWQTMRT